VVGDHPVRGFVRAVRIDAGEFRHHVDDRAEQVDLVVVVGALEHRGDALEPHAGVDRGARQVDAGLRIDLFGLYEQQVPHFDETGAPGAGRAGRAAGNVFAVVVEDFRARPARTGVAHGPEIIRAGDAQ